MVVAAPEEMVSRVSWRGRRPLGERRRAARISNSGRVTSVSVRAWSVMVCMRVARRRTRPMASMLVRSRSGRRWAQLSR